MITVILAEMILMNHCTVARSTWSGWAGKRCLAMAPHSSPLAWKIPWTEGPGRLQSMGSLRVGHDWATSLSFFTFHFPALEKEMATRSSVLAWRIPGMAGPGGLPSMGSYRVGHDWSDLAAAAALVWRLSWLDFPVLDMLHALPLPYTGEARYSHAHVWPTKAELLE